MSKSLARRLVYQLPPGSDEAREKGCSCPVLDNGHGKGYLGGVKDEHGTTLYVISGACALHAGAMDDYQVGVDEGGKG